MYALIHVASTFMHFSAVIVEAGRCIRAIIAVETLVGHGGWMMTQMTPPVQHKARKQLSMVTRAHCKEF